jgi:hypothetical protein
VARARYTTQEADSQVHDKLETIIWGTQDMELTRKDVGFIRDHIAPTLTCLVHPMVRFWCMLCSQAQLPYIGSP